MDLTADEEAVLDVFCRRGARLHVAHMIPDQMPRGARTMDEIRQSLVAKGYLSLTEDFVDTFHLTERGVAYCGGIDKIPLAPAMPHTRRRRPPTRR